MMSLKHLVAWFIAASAISCSQTPESDNTSPLVPVCDPSVFSLSRIAPSVKITSIEAQVQRLATTPGGTPESNGLNHCQVKVRLNHERTDDSVLVEVWLPLSRDDWNGRFLATGGGGWVTGMLGRAIAPAVKQGYAASSTDGGHDVHDHGDASWVLESEGTTNWNLLHNFATRSLVEQITIGKTITEQFYQEKPHHSYWSGCSQGGRQGYVLAQQYPDLLDGILAIAPAISLTKLVMAEFWPQLVMKEEGRWMSSCEFNYFRQKAMESCDMIDGVSDGVISELDQCDFDPLHLIGQVFYCNEEYVEVTEAMANIVRRIGEGPRTPLKAPIWHGLAHGTTFEGIANTSTSSNGVRASNPFSVSTHFIQNFLLRQFSFNVTQLNYASYMALWAQAGSEYGWLLDADNADLTRLQSSGTKLLTWHGTNDPLIPYQSTVQYRKRVEMLMGGANEVDKFYRLFLAPGVEHCAGGIGPVPKDSLAALVDWVEDGTAPETLEAVTTTYEGDLVTRELCAWPGNARYLGIGDAKRWSSWSCVGGTERPEEGLSQEEEKLETGRAGQILEGLKDRLEGLGLGLTIG
ncbi:hypothetical protein N0V90_004282 [Kalmusia sp. IMI 367209]|nr:hypothetical protein N0V90_004282 [Kalmusia sp. IMI 367209]